MNNSQLVSSSNNWKLVGNTLTGTEFLGSTNAQPLIFKANNTEAARFYSGTAFVLTGDVNNGVAPNIGAGRRMMWIPAKAAFRAGEAVGNEWDNNNIGTHSYAMGINNIASGASSGALGIANTVTDVGSFAIGTSNTTTGSNNVLMGSGNIVSASFSNVIGTTNTLSNPNFGAANVLGNLNAVDSPGSSTIGYQNSVSSPGDSFTIGRNNINTGQSSFVMGTYGSTNGKYGAWIFSDSSTIGPNTYVQSDIPNQLKGRFAGGYKFNITNTRTIFEVTPIGTVRINELATTDTEDVRITPAGDLTTNVRRLRFVQTQSIKSLPANTTSPQNSIGTGVGSLTLPNLQVGDILRVRCVAHPSGSVSSSTIQGVNLNAIINSQTITLNQVNLTGHPNSYPFTIDYDIIVNSTNTVSITGNMVSPYNQGPATNTNGVVYAISVVSQTVTFGGLNTIGQEIQFTVVDGSSGWHTLSYSLELLRI